MFDPEKVERHAIWSADDDVEIWPTHQRGYATAQQAYESVAYVHATDYDKLLDIHLRHVKMIAGLFERCGEPLSEEKIASLKNGTWR